MTRFLIYDVFTDRPFGGNPLGVIPNATETPEDQLQKIAREFNFSETTFVYPPKDPSHTARVRIFTPTREIPFAGHPVIGTAVALHDLGQGTKMTFELGVGPIAVEAEDGMASFTATQPLERGGHPSPEAVAACTGLDADDIRTDQMAPIQAGLGLEMAFAELRDLDALIRANPVTDAFRSAARAYPTKLDFALMVYVRDGGTIQARMFAPLDNIPEDPATGSAAAALSALLAEADGRASRFVIHQGKEMGRPSRIETDVVLHAGQTAAVTVSGQAVSVAEGVLTL
ncbi:MAG: PhzF family phenazine biosynthesis protein [Pseudomonadota bacterium]